MSDPSRSKTLYKICGWICLLPVVNFLAFMVIYFLIGGDAIHGGVAEGHYYVADHGHSIEVSYGIWLYSLVHAYSVLISIPLAIAAATFAIRIRKNLNPGSVTG